MEEEKKPIIENEEELLKKVEKAAEKGAKKGGLKNALISVLPVLIVIGVLAYLFIPKFNTLTDRFTSIFGFDTPVADHDETLENYRIFGYKVADFADAVLGDSEKLKKLEVFKQDVSDVATLTDTGLFNWSVFTKSQMITYYGEATYTVDLSKLSAKDFELDDDNKTIIVYIPHAVQEEINIPEDRIQFADPDKGLLAFGKMEFTPEQVYKVQSEARNRMQEKLDADKVVEQADRFAKLVVWEMLTPIIKSVAPFYSLQVEFR